MKSATSSHNFSARGHGKWWWWYHIVFLKDIACAVMNYMHLFFYLSWNINLIQRSLRFYITSYHFQNRDLPNNNWKFTIFAKALEVLESKNSTTVKTRQTAQCTPVEKPYHFNGWPWNLVGRTTSYISSVCWVATVILV